MNRIILLLSITLSSMCFSFIYGQISPNSDNNWELITSKSDEFNDQYLDNSKWVVFNKDDYPWGEGYCFCDEQVFLDSGILHLRVDKKVGYDTECRFPYSPFYSGGIRSINHDYSYGYYEIRAKLPGSFINGEPNGWGFWPAFWTYYVEENDTCRIIHDEIDILEPSGEQFKYAKTNVAGWHDEDPDCKVDHIKICDVVFTYHQPLFEEFHNYAVEWLPDRIIFYFDYKPFHIEYNHPSMIMQPQFVVIDQQMQRNIPVNINMPFPQFMLIDYFRYYKLIDGFCEQDLVIQNNLQLNNYSWGVYQNITIGNGSNSVFLQNGDHKTFRAVNEIILQGDFTTPIGSELNLIPTPCSITNQQNNIVK